MASNRWSPPTSALLEQDDELQLWAVSAGASSLIVDLKPYEAVRVAGSVIKLVIDPIAGDIDAYVWDGTGYVIARWHIIRPTPRLVIVPGRRVVVAGTSVSENDCLVMVEPLIELIEPEIAA